MQIILQFLKETITYRFGDDYNGQLVGLGKAGKMPEGFDIDPDPTVQVSKNGRIIQNVSFYTMEEEDGYKVKFTMLAMPGILFG